MIPQDWKRELAWPDLTEIWTCRSHLNGAQSKRERERKKKTLIISPTLRNKLILHQIVWCNTRSCVVFNYKMSSKRKRTASYQIFISQLSWKNIFWWRRYRLKFISHIYLMFPLRERERERRLHSAKIFIRTGGWLFRRSACFTIKNINHTILLNNLPTSTVSAITSVRYCAGNVRYILDRKAYLNAQHIISTLRGINCSFTNVKYLFGVSALKLVASHPLTAISTPVIS